MPHLASSLRRALLAAPVFLAGSAAITATLAAGPVLAAAAERGPIPLVPIEAGTCKAFAPQDWRILDQSDQSSIFSLQSADGSLIATYAATYVNGYKARQYGPPEQFALGLVAYALHEQAVRDGPEQTVGYYKALPFKTPSRAGYVLIYSFAVPDPDPSAYGVILRFAIGPDLHSASIAGLVAASSDCVVGFRPPPGGFEDWQPPAEIHGTGRGNSDEATLGGTYNAQLGTGWVHDGAGTPYLVDVTADYHEVGPDGPGYYKRNGNDWIKLQPGFE